MDDEIKRMIDVIKMYDSYTIMESEKLKIPEYVLQAIKKVPRHMFVPLEQKRFAYQDSPLSIGYGQTISQPYIVALMTALLDPKPNYKILEIGTGSGYQAAILSKIVDKVYTVEVVEELMLSAKEKFNNMGYKNVYCKYSDGHMGWKDFSPFDGIIVTAAAEKIPESLVEQLKNGGKMVIPVGGPFSVQQLLVIHKTEKGTIIKENTIDVRFVPLIRKEI